MQSIGQVFRPLFQKQTTPFAQIPRPVILDNRLSSPVFRFLCFLIDVGNEDGVSWYGSKKLGEIFNVSERTVGHWKKELVDLGYVSVKRRIGRSSVIRVLVLLSRDNTPKPPSVEQDPEAEPRKKAMDELCEEEEVLPEPEVQDPLEQEVELPDKNKKQTEQYPTQQQPAEGGKIDRAIEKLTQVAEQFGLAAFQSISALRQGGLRRLLEAIGGISLEALRFAFSFVESLRGTAKYPRTLKFFLTLVVEKAALYREAKRPVQPPVEESRKTSSGTVTGQAQENQWRGSVAPELEETWGKVLDEIQGMVPESTFNRWFANLGVEEGEDGVTVICQDEFDMVFTEKNFSDLIRIFLASTLGKETVVRFAAHPFNLVLPGSRAYRGAAGDSPRFGGSADSMLESSITG